MSNCSNHKKDLFGETDMKKVAEAIGDLHYETMHVLLLEIMWKLARDSGKDAAAGRVQLAKFLLSASDNISNVKK